MAATTGVATATMIAPSSSLVLAAPTSPAVTNTFNVSVNAAVIGNRFEVQRAVTKALRGYARLNGSRN
jgi:hypothetical protein